LIFGLFHKVGFKTTPLCKLNLKIIKDNKVEKKTLIFYPSFFHDFIKKTSKQWYFVKTEVENIQRWQS